MTAELVAVVLARPLDSYRRLPPPRDELERDDCACGGAVWRRTPDALRAHQATPEHRAWRRRNGL